MPAHEPPACGYCKQPAALTTGAVLYPGKPKLAALRFWHCEPCGAWVGCHPAAQNGGMGDGTVPLGSLANPELRRWRTTAHQLFDELWQSKEMSRAEAYAWMARRLRLRPDQCHIGSFDVALCKALVEAVAARGG